MESFSSSLSASWCCFLRVQGARVAWHSPASSACCRSSPSGWLSLLIALDPHSTFLSGNEWYPEAMTPLSASVGRPVFALSGVLLIGLGIWQIVRREWNRPDPEE